MFGPMYFRELRIYTNVNESFPLGPHSSILGGVPRSTDL